MSNHSNSVDVVEFEPQTAWIAKDAINGPFREYEPIFHRIDALPHAKLIHSVGIPLGGTRKPSQSQMELVRRAAERFNSPWVSEHLSVAGTPHQSAGFLLPPLQTDEGIELASENISLFQRGISKPVAIETGVSYLSRKEFEMRDGEFTAAVATSADCGILLDLHNIYCNEQNGRTSMDDFLADLPLDRVWEVHLAGGFEKDGYWLDAHSGPMSADFAKRARDIIAYLPNLGAINFEIYPTFLKGLEDDQLIEILNEIRDIWEAAGNKTCNQRKFPNTELPVGPTPQLWESTLTQSIWKQAQTEDLFSGDAKAINLYSTLTNSFRGSLLVRALPRALRYLFITRNDQGVAPLNKYFTSHPAQLFASLEAREFLNWVRANETHDNTLQALIEYDIATATANLEGITQIVHFPGNPSPIFEALAEGKPPPKPVPPIWEIEILPDRL